MTTQADEVMASIVRGDLDDDLGRIQRACSSRMQRRFRPGSRVRVKDSRDRLNGIEGTVDRVNQKTVSVTLDNHTAWRFPPQMLEAVEA